VQYLADLKPEAGLAPRHGTFERVRLQEWMHFIATELHKNLSPLYNPKAPTSSRPRGRRRRCCRRLDFLAKSLEAGLPHGDGFTVADAYAFYCLRAWSGAMLKGDLSAWKVLADYHARIASAPRSRPRSRPKPPRSEPAKGPRPEPACSLGAGDLTCPTRQGQIAEFPRRTPEPPCLSAKSRTARTEVESMLKEVYGPSAVLRDAGMPASRPRRRVHLQERQGKLVKTTLGKTRYSRRRIQLNIVKAARAFDAAGVNFSGSSKTDKVNKNSGGWATAGRWACARA